MAKSVKRCNNKNRQKVSRKRNNNKGRNNNNKGKSVNKKSKSRRNKKSRSMKRKGNKNANNLRGGALASYRYHQDQGFLNRINPHAHSLPLTYRADHVVEDHSNQYSISH